jgi:tRNA-Thr(GGU) m(6)t(6)A37 methyltransferase TsaA
MTVTLEPIGVVRTDAAELPRHWSISDVEGMLVINADYAAGLRDITPGQRIVVLFHFDRSPAITPEYLRQISGDSGKETGVFSTCSPVRPNPIGLSVLDVLAIAGTTIHVHGLDMLDGTPILDLKPHIETGRSGEPDPRDQ